MNTKLYKFTPLFDRRIMFGDVVLTGSPCGPEAHRS